MILSKPSPCTWAASCHTLLLNSTSSKAMFLSQDDLLSDIGIAMGIPFLRLKNRVFVRKKKSSGLPAERALPLMSLLPRTTFPTQHPQIQIDAVFSATWI